jgi:hypothetical protein
MNVAQALKRKARLLKELNDKWTIIKSHNSIISGNRRKYNIKTELDSVENLFMELVELKTKIHLANGPVYDKIFLLSELKTQLRNLEGISTAEGTVDNGRYGIPSTAFYEVEIDEIYKNGLINQLTTKIDKLQDELDYHNATTGI